MKNVYVFHLFLSVLMLVYGVGCAPMAEIHKAASQGSVGQVDRLLAGGADINDFSPVHGTALRIAASQGDRAMVEHLLDQGADVNGGAPLVGAAWYGQVDIAGLLLDRGADVNNGGWNADSPLGAAARENQQDMVALLLAAKAHPDGGGGGEPLWIAAYRGYDDIVLQLLIAGANANLHDCLEVAVCQSPSDLTTSLLLQYGADVHGVDERRMSALHFAALYGRPERVRLLLQYGANRKLKDKSGKTAEHYAREQGYRDIEDMLL